MSLRRPDDTVPMFMPMTEPAVGSPLSASPSSLSEQGFGARYTVHDILGEGGMGEVRLCRDIRIGRDVAVKTIRADLGSQSGFQGRFLREARVQGGLEHPSIVPVYDLGIGPEGAAYFTMKRVRGMTLADVLDKLRSGEAGAARQYSRRKLLTAFSSVCLAIEFAHAHSVLHRDLKPSNIMLGAFGEVYVLDWGVAKIISEDTLARKFDTTESVATEAGVVVGTIGYMSPEQITEASELGRTTDVYSLGAILFELLTLKMLHEGTGPEVLASTVKDANARASLRAPDREVPPELEAICVKATALEPHRRYESARAFHEALERYLDGDRDTELRRQLAEGHAATAFHAAEKALSDVDQAMTSRATAMREAGMALALDPSNVIAMGTITRLMLEPPPQIPPEAQASINRDELRTISVRGQMGAPLYASWFVWLPFIVMMGVRSWAWTAVASICFGCGFALSLFQVRRPEARPAFVVALVAGCGFVAMGRLFSPLILVPAAALVLTVASALDNAPRKRRIALVSALVSVFGPILLEWVGVLPPSFAFRDGTLVIFPQMSELPVVASSIVLVLAHLMILVGLWRLVGRVRDARVAAEEKLAVQAWHLRQIVPGI